jgi:Peptidase family M23
VGITPREMAWAAGAVLALPLLTMGPGVARPAITGKALFPGPHEARAPSPAPAPDGLRPLRPTACPQGAIPDGEACVTLPQDEDPIGAAEPEVMKSAHHDRRGRYVSYDQIPRRPERPADYNAYRYPVPCEGACVFSGYDLDRPDDEQRRGRHLHYVGHGAVDILQKRGTEVRLVSLEHQIGDAEVVYAGPLFGTTVITRHTLRESGELRDYLLLYGHLQENEVQGGAHLADGDLVGLVGDSGSSGLVHLHLETRRLRPGVDVGRLGTSVAQGKVSPFAMIADENSVVCDPRNVLPLP